MGYHNNSNKLKKKALIDNIVSTLLPPPPLQGLLVSEFVFILTGLSETESVSIFIFLLKNNTLVRGFPSFISLDENCHGKSSFQFKTDMVIKDFQ